MLACDNVRSGPTQSPPVRGIPWLVSLRTVYAVARTFFFSPIVDTM